MAAATILIVDDNRPLAGSLAELLARRSFRTLVAGTASAGLRMAGRLRPDLVIADVDLPDFSGTELVERLAAAVPDVPVILISAGPGDPVVRRCPRSVYATLGKPFDPLRLIVLVHKALRLLAPVAVEFPLVRSRRLLPVLRRAEPASLVSARGRSMTPGLRHTNRTGR